MTKRQKVNYSFVAVIAYIILCLIFQPIIIPITIMVGVGLVALRLFAQLLYVLLEELFGIKDND